MTERNDYWHNLISTALRYLEERKNANAVIVIKNASFSVEFCSHDNWNGGIDYWDFVFSLKYKDFTVIEGTKQQIERDLLDAINLFHYDDCNIINSVIIRPMVEFFINWRDVYPTTKEEAIQLILEEQELLTDVSVGKVLFKQEGKEREYTQRHRRIIDIAKRAGFYYPIETDSLSSWWAEIKKIKTYVERRAYIQRLFSPLLQKLNDSTYEDLYLDFHQMATKSDTVQKAIEDAELFIREGKMESAVDRIHTAFHGYLQIQLEKHGKSFQKDDSISSLFNNLIDCYQASIHPENVAKRVKTILRSGGGMINAINELRNNNTTVHPNEQLIQKREAMLVLHLMNAMVTYIEDVESQFENG